MTHKGGAKPELKKYMDKRMSIAINDNRHVEGVMRGFDQFMNITLDDAYEIVNKTEKNFIGMVMIRGNAVEMIEALQPINLS